MKFILGLIGLGIMVTIHEFGHFLFARLFKVEVLSFSIGWGPKIFSKKSKKSGTEFRISALPLGGYCQMKGEAEFAESLKTKSKKINAEEGSLYFLKPWKRLLIAFAGPFFNLLSAILIFIIIAFIGNTTYTASNKVIVIEDPMSESIQHYPAYKAGIRTGDKIVEIEGKEILYFSDIQEQIYPKGNKTVNISINRNGKILDFKLKPFFNKDYGNGVIGVYPWINLIIDNVKNSSSSHIAGLKAGDKIISVNDKNVSNTLEFYTEIEKSNKSSIKYIRENKEFSTNIIYSPNETENNIGLSFKMLKKESPSYGFIGAIKYGFKKPIEILSAYVKGFSLLSKVNLNTAVQGPIRMTGMIGDTIIDGFSAGLKSGIVQTLSFIAIISIILFFMNLLPIPALDGGLIVLCIIEMIIRRPLKPKSIYIYQIIGFIIIMLLIFLVMFNDIFYYVIKGL